MKIILDEEMLTEYMAKAVGVSPEKPLLPDEFPEGAIDTEADAISDCVSAEGIKERQNNAYKVKSLLEYHREIEE